MAQDENAEAERGGQLCHQSCRTGHTAKDEVIGEFEEIHTNAHDGDAQGDDRVLADVRHDLFPLIVFHTVFPFSAPAGVLLVSPFFAGCFAAHPISPWLL